MKSSRTRRAEVERLMDLMREANGRLVVAAVHAQNLSDEARAAAAQARSELDELTKQLRDANERLAAQVPAIAEGPDRVAGTPGPGHLTPRQREVLRLVAEGKSNKEIGTILGMTAKTADTHRTHIMARLDLHTMSELVRYAIRNRVIKP
jgi:DNA-binding CsgD family transcriptional regulator